MTVRPKSSSNSTRRAYPSNSTLSHPTLKLAVVANADGLAIVHEITGGGQSSPHYLAVGARVRSIRIYLDRGSIEVFANDGRYTGTKRLADPAPVNRHPPSSPSGTRHCCSRSGGSAS